MRSRLTYPATMFVTTGVWCPAPASARSARYFVRTLAVLLFAALAAAVAAVPASGAQPPAADPPVIVLPPDELRPSRVYRVEADGVDWGVGKLNAPAAHLVTKGKGVKVAVLDTGVDPSHPDLAAAIAGPDDLKNFTGSRFGVTDRQGHGTHCCGRVLARGVNYGVAPEAGLIAGKVLGDDGSGTVDGIAAGIRWAAKDRGADVISMSLGGGGRDSYLPPALAEAEALGVIVVAAAGNDGPAEGTVGYPGGYAQCVAVGATDIADAIARFSSRGPALFVAAPGKDIRSQYPGGQYATMSGTSMATPHVAGLAALWVAAHPEIPKKDRPAAFRAALKAACKDLGPVGRDAAFGWGLPDAAKLVAAGGTVPPPPPPPPGGFTGDVAVVVTFKDGKPVGAKLGTPGGATVDREAIERAVKEQMDRALTEAAAGTRAIDWSGLIRAIVEAVLRSLIGGKADGGELPAVTRDLPTPTPAPPALAVPRFAPPLPFAFPVPQQSQCPGGVCPPRVAMPW